MPGPYADEVVGFDPIDMGDEPVSTEEQHAFRTRRRLPVGTLNEGDIVKVCAWATITRDLHHAVGEIVELFYSEQIDGETVIEDTRVMFPSKLNGDNPDYERFYNMPDGIMLFPHEIEVAEPREPTWEL